MMKNRIALGLLLFASRFISGQEPTLESTFDVASVKAARLGGGGDTAIHIEDGRVYCKCLLNQMIQEASSASSEIWRPAELLSRATAAAAWKLLACHSTTCGPNRSPVANSDI